MFTCSNQNILIDFTGGKNIFIRKKKIRINNLIDKKQKSMFSIDFIRCMYSASHRWIEKKL